MHTVERNRYRERSMKMEVGDCRRWDEEAYRNSILQERESHCLTVFRTAFPPNPNPNPDLIAAASGDGSVAVYSISSLLSSSHAYAFGNHRGQSALLAEPVCLLQGHDGPAYDVKFLSTKEGSLLLSCGDDGQIRGWRWDQILKAEKLAQGGHSEPVLDLMNPQHRGPWGALSPIPENNAIAVDSQGGSVFSAAGDSCAYCWDLEKGAIKMAFNGHSDYLHCIVTRNHGNQIITGSEDGTARLWDCRTGKCIQVINPEKEKQLKGRYPVSCIALDASENWLSRASLYCGIWITESFIGNHLYGTEACGSGRSLSVWGLPAREFISRTSTHASVQDICFDDNHILTVGAKPLLSRFDMNGVILSLIQCAPQSAFSVSLHPSGVTAVSGYGGVVDVISQFGSHLCTFQADSHSWSN